MSIWNVLGFAGCYLLGNYDGKKQMKKECMEEIQRQNTQNEIIALKAQIEELKMRPK